MTLKSNALTDKLINAKVVLFDFDGPLCDVFAGLPAPTIARRLENKLGERVETDDPLEVLRKSVEFGAAAVNAIEYELVAAELEAIETSTPTVGGLESIQACLNANKSVGVVSNNSAQAITKFLARAGFMTKINPVIGRPYANPRLMKPHPHSLQTALQSLRIDPKYALFIGDSMSDIEASEAAGTQIVMYAHTSSKRKLFSQKGVDIVESMTDFTTAASSLQYVSETKEFK